MLISIETHITCEVSRGGLDPLWGLYRGFRDTGYLPFYFLGYRILSILLPGIWDTVFNIWYTFRDIEYFEKKKQLWGYLPVYKGYLPVYFKGYGKFGTPYTSLPCPHLWIRTCGTECWLGSIVIFQGWGFIPAFLRNYTAVWYVLEQFSTGST